MPRDNLLKEAIADAKTVRDTAIANARLTLEEAFKPHLSSMLSARLRNEIEGIEGEGINEDNDGSSEIGSGLTVDDPSPKMPSKKSSDSSHIENPKQEFDTMGDGNIHKKPLKEADFPQKGGDDIDDIDLDAELDMDGGGAPDASGAPAPTAAPQVPQAPQAGGAGIGGGMDTGMGGGPDLGMGGAGAGAGMDGMANTPDELDLEAIIRELELDVQDDSQMGGAPQGGAPVAQNPQFESFQDAQAGNFPDGAFEGGTKMRTETLAGKPGEGTDKDGKSPTAVDGVNGGKKVSPGQAVTGSKAETMSEEVDLDEILREVEAEEAASKSGVIATENVELKRSLREHREVIQFLRVKLQEVNMLNAKLLFTNKLFKGFQLGEVQKLHIVESFDRATTLREVKLIYTTLAESLNGKLANQKKGAKVVAEGMASKPTGSTKPKSLGAHQQTILTEGNEMVARLQKLAGIKTN